jgi:hypothetical protein
VVGNSDVSTNFRGDQTGQGSSGAELQNPTITIFHETLIIEMIAQTIWIEEFKAPYLNHACSGKTQSLLPNILGQNDTAGPDKQAIVLFHILNQKSLTTPKRNEISGFVLSLLFEFFLFFI